METITVANATNLACSEGLMGGEARIIGAKALLPKSSSVDEVRDQLRARCIDSLYFLCKNILGFKDLTPELHGWMAQEAQSPIHRLLMLIPRNHFKSTIGSRGFPIWELINDLEPTVPADLTILPPCNDRILLTNASEVLVCRFVGWIKGIWERNDTFKWLFPETIPDFNKTTWAADAMLIRRSGEYPEPSITAIGVKGKITGWHGNCQIWDDLVEREAAESEAVMRMTIDFFKTTVSLFNDPEHDIGRMYGTPWTHNDVYRHVAEELPYDPVTGYGFKILSRSVIENDEPIFPQRFSKKYVGQLLKEQGPRMFNLQYMCSFDDPSIKEFDVTSLRTYTVDPQTGKITFSALNPASGLEETCEIYASQMDRVGLIDPAMGEDKKKSAKCAPAVVLTGTADVFGSLSVFVLMAWTGQLTPDKVLDRVYATNKTFTPRGWVVEPFAFQKSLNYWIHERNREDKHGYVNVLDVPRGSFKDKVVRMRGLIPYFGHRRVYVPEGSFEFIKQMDRAPYGKPIDLFDAFSMGIHVWRRPGSSDYDSDDRGSEYNDDDSRREACASPRTGY